MKNMLDALKSRINTSRKSPKQSPVYYHKSFNNPGLYPQTSRPKVIKTLNHFSSTELVNIEASLLADPRHQKQLQILDSMKKYYQKK